MNRNAARASLAFVMLLLTLSCFGDEGKETSPLWLTVTKDVGYLFPAYAINLGAHEGGHALLARVFDDQVSLTLRIGRVGLLEGYVEYSDEKVPGWYRPWVAGAGTAFNVGTALLSNLALETGAIPYDVQPLFSQVYLIGQLDFASNLTNAFVIDLSQGFRNQDTSNDFHNLVYYLSWDKSVFSKSLIYTGLFALLAADLYLSRDTLVRNGRVLGGAYY